MGSSRIRVLVLAGWACVAIPAQADDRPVPGLNWLRLAGAERCSTANVIAERVEARAQQLVFGSAVEAELFVDGFVRRAEAGGWDVQLEVSTPDGRVWGRRALHFEGEDCSVVDDAVALVIAVTLYPNTGLVDAGIPLTAATGTQLDALFGDEPSEPDATSLPVLAVEPGAPDKPEPPVIVAHRAQPAAWGLDVDLAGIAGFGQLPGAGFGMAAHAQLDLPGIWPIDVGFSLFGSRTVAARDVSGSGRFGLVLGSLATCPWSPGWLPALALCGGAELGSLRAEPADFAQTPAELQAFVAALTVAAVIRARLAGGLHLRVAPLVAFPLIQHRYVYRMPAAGSGELYRMAPVSVRLEIGAGWTF